jgi:L-ascorbate metabolism protein UlaG (beta-lactamase superfamily)
MRITKYSQSTFALRNSTGSTLLIDPGKYNFQGTFAPMDFGKVDILVVTHKHPDHFEKNAVKEIFQTHRPLVVTNREIAYFLSKDGIPARGGQIGDVIEAGGFKLELIKTDHVVRDEVIINFGLCIESDGEKIYHTSDTRLMEAEVLPADKLNSADVICVPIGNRGVVMGFDDALYFCNQFGPRIIVPMHYDSPKDKARVNPQHFVERFRVLSGVLKELNHSEVKVLGFSETLELV